MPYVVHPLSAMVESEEFSDEYQALQDRLNSWESEGFLLQMAIPRPDGEQVLIFHRPADWKEPKRVTGQVRGY